MQVGLPSGKNTARLRGDEGESIMDKKYCFMEKFGWDQRLSYQNWQYKIKKPVTRQTPQNTEYTNRREQVYNISVLIVVTSIGFAY